MRFSRRTRCPSTNSLILLVTIVLVFVLFIRRHSDDIKNDENDSTTEDDRFAYLDNINFLESMKKMFSKESQGETTLSETARRKPKVENIYRVILPTINGTEKNEKHTSLLTYDTKGDDLALVNYDVEFSNASSEHITMTFDFHSPITNNSRFKNTPKAGQDLILRTEKIEKQCERLSVFGTPDNEVHPIMTNRENKLAYCFIPKCGCTFWKRIMRFLNKDFKDKNISSPFQIRRLETHSFLYSNPDTFLPFHVYRKISRAYSSFMFVREPYARLWSAYVDKFYLPDFWSNFKKQIKSNRHPSYSRRCVNDVTFQEFVRLSLDTQEPHWDPMHQMCDPCTYKPNFVGRVESFSSDAQHILEQANLSWIMDGYDHAMHVQEEVVTLINYNFELIAVKPYISRCINKVGLFRRLWKTFQINGYLPADAVPFQLDETTTVAEFIEIVLDQYRRRPNTPDVWRKQRREFMVAAYKTISTASLHDLRMKYARDFLLFNYDPRPADIYVNRY